MTYLSKGFKIIIMGNEYIKKFDTQCIESKGKKLLLHCCCAPCSSATLEALCEHFEVTVYFYNPNIQPYGEFEKRANEQIRFIKEHFKNRIRVIIAPYEGERFSEIARGREHLPEKSERCYLCYRLRMESCAKFAREHGFDAFTTSLSISPHKNAQWINEIGEELEKSYGIEFIASDFKKRNGYKRSIELSREYGLYRQDWCGCIYSKKEKHG